MKSLFILLVSALMFLGSSMVGFTQTQDQLGYSYNQLGPGGYGSTRMGTNDETGTYGESQMGTDDQSNGGTYGKSQMGTDDQYGTQPETDMNGQSGSTSQSGYGSSEGRHRRRSNRERYRRRIQWKLSATTNSGPLRRALSSDG